MEILSSVFLSVFICCITTVITTDKPLQTFTGLRGKGYKLSDGFVNQTLDNIRLIPCINTCSTEASCRSVSWNSDNQKCLLGLTDVTGYHEASTQLSEVSGWNTYSLMEYTGERSRAILALLFSENTVEIVHDGMDNEYGQIFLASVFVAKYPHLDQHTFDEASQLCIELGTRLASPDDLLYSHSIGFGYFRSTWLSDGSIGYILRHWSEIYYVSISWYPWALCVLN